MFSNTLIAIWHWITAHQLLCAWIGAVMIDQLPAPAQQGGSGLYKWFFGVTQTIAANINRGVRGLQGRLDGGQGPKV